MCVLIYLVSVREVVGLERCHIERFHCNNAID